MIRRPWEVKGGARERALIGTREQGVSRFG
jgi:hypothetical protein